MHKKAFIPLILLTIVLIGALAWVMLRHVYGKGTEQARSAAYERNLDAVRWYQRISELDLTVMEGPGWSEALEEYRSLLDSVPGGLKDLVLARIRSLEKHEAYSISQQSDELGTEVVVIRQRETISSLRDSIVHLQRRLGGVRDSGTSVVESLMSGYERTKQELGAREKVQVITFNSPKGGPIHYLGEVLNGKANGGGVGIWTTGSLYRGQWRNNVRHGQGTFEWADGERYEGTYVDGVREGVGKYHWPSGDRYEGQWKDDRRNGQGTLFDMDGNIRYKGNWKDDKPVDRAPGSVAP